MGFGSVIVSGFLGFSSFMLASLLFVLVDWIGLLCVFVLGFDVYNLGVLY